MGLFTPSVVSGSGMVWSSPAALSQISKVQRPETGAASEICVIFCIERFPLVSIRTGGPYNHWHGLARRWKSCRDLFQANGLTGSWVS